MTTFVYSKFRWDLSIYHFPETWMVQNIEKKANRDIRKWLSMPISGNVNHLRLKVKQLGIGLRLSSDIYSSKQITVWNILQSSKNQSMRELFEITGMINIRNDSIVKRSANAKIAKSTLDNEIQNKIKTWMNNLKEQTTLMSSLQQNLPKTLKINWNSLTNTLPPNIFNFCGKALIFSLNKNNNLAHWTFVTRATVTCVTSLKCKSIFSTTALLQSMIVNWSGVTTRFSRPFCSILPAQTSMMCLLTLRDIEVLLYCWTHQFKT